MKNEIIQFLRENIIGKTLLLSLIHIYALELVLNKCEGIRINQSLMAVSYTHLPFIQTGA